MHELRQQARSLSHQLMPPAFDHLSLSALLAHYAHSTSAETGLKVSFTASHTDNSDEPAMPAAVSHELYRIMALDDHPVVAAGISHILSAYDITTTNQTQQMLHLLHQGQKFHLFILDLELPDADDFEALKCIRQHCPDCAILIYTMHEEPWIVARLASLNIQGIVSKTHAVGALLEAVESIRRGETFFDANFSTLLQQLINGNAKSPYMPGNPFQLSERESQVLRCIADGLSTPEISERLFISENTVGTYRRRLMAKFDAHNVAQLISKARKHLDI